MTWRVIQGDCVEVLRTLDPESIDAVVTDPPYGIGFMGHEWDQPGDFGPVSAGHGGCNVSFGGPPHPAMEAGRYDLSATANRRFQGWVEQWAAECLRVLKPGGHLLAFGGTRTYHRLTSGVEDAGFKIRDCLAWLYGSGFPKSLDPLRMMLSLPRSTSREQFRRWHQLARVLGGTALKPAFEPIVLARKPLAGSVAANLLEHGTGPLNIDGCRIDGAARPARERNFNGARQNVYEGGPLQGSRAVGDTTEGRWPANVLLDDEAAQLLDEMTGDLAAGAFPLKDGLGYHGGSGHTRPERVDTGSGGASRFFYVAKASRSERNAGLDGLATETARVHHTPTSTLHHGRSGGKIVDGRKPVPRPRANQHPTVKPVDVMAWLIRRWLIRLACPPEGVVLDPFTGSGTTGIACLREGMSFVGIEREPGYCELARERIRNDQPLIAVMTEVAA